MLEILPILLLYKQRIGLSIFVENVLRIMAEYSPLHADDEEDDEVDDKSPKPLKISLIPCM